MDKHSKNTFQTLMRKPFAMVLGAVMLMLVSILAVLFIDSIEKKHALRLDFSFNSVTSQSRQAKEIVKALPHPVHAYAIATPGQEDQALLGLLNRFSAESPNFTYSRENLVNNPLLANRLSSLLTDQAVSSDSLLLVCEATGRSRVLSGLDYLTQSFDMDRQAYFIDGLQYEKAISEALVFLTQQSIPKVYLLDGHGELQQEHTQVMEEFLRGHHFEVQRLNLSGKATLPQDALLFILSPKVDLSQEELGMLDEFAKNGGAMLITSDYTDPDSLPNFDALYRSLGFVRQPGIVIADTDDQAAYLDNPLFLTPYMQITEATGDLVASAQTRLRLPGARALTALLDTDSRRVETMLLSGQAYTKAVDEASQSLVRAADDPEGQFALGLLSLTQQAQGKPTRAAILGNSAMLVDSWLYEITYSSQFLLHLANYLSPNQPINLDIAPKTLVREQLDIPQLIWPVLAVIALPVAIAGLAFVHLAARRKRSS